MTAEVYSLSTATEMEKGRTARTTSLVCHSVCMNRFNRALSALPCDTVAIGFREESSVAFVTLPLIQIHLESRYGETVLFQIPRFPLYSYAEPDRKGEE